MARPEDGEAGVQPASCHEHPTQRGSRSFRCDEDHVHVGGRYDAGLLFIGDAEAVREIQGFPGCQVFLDGGPEGDLAGVGEEELDDGAFFAGFFDLEEGLAGYPAVGDGFVPGLGVLALADDDVEAVVAQVHGLAGPLNAVADDGDGFVFQDLFRFAQREFFAGDDAFFYAAEVDFCHLFVVVFLCLFFVVSVCGVKVGIYRRSCDVPYLFIT